MEISELVRGMAVERINSHKKWENGRVGRVLAWDAETKTVEVYWFKGKAGDKISGLGWSAIINLKKIE